MTVIAVVTASNRISLLQSACFIVHLYVSVVSIMVNWMFHNLCLVH